MKVSYKKMILAIGVVIFLVFLGYIIYEGYNSYRIKHEIDDIRAGIESEKTIIHAAGGIIGKDGELHTYTNSLEAIQGSIAAGNHFIEIDFIQTTDKKVICASDKKYFDATEEEFMSKPVDGEFTPMNIDILAGVMYDNPDIYIITDVRNGNVAVMGRIRDRYPDLSDRFIVQVYHDSEYREMKKMGYDHIIFTLYQTEDHERSPEALQKAVKKHDYVGITFWEEWLTDGNFYNSMMELDVPLYVHTVDDHDSIRSDIDMGMSAVYTDNTDNDWIR
ncbi:MAG: hypothetical protein K6G12_08490 [Lachnospiraceae bacterium]|nr:hypothetical protein [Lachnospiraceae bacterium]